ncbi:MAG TPA: tetratricopeptide repeat protein [Humisphaera sp.]
MTTLKLLAVTIGTLALFARCATGAEPATRPAKGPQSPEHSARLERVVERASALIAADAGHAAAYQARAEALFRLGRIDESVRDFDKAVALAPDAMPHNWQRGLALYYAGRFDDGARQFERHKEVNPQDVENAAWHFLCVARREGPAKGPAAARAQLIPIEADARVPLMKVQAMLAGRATPADVLAAAAEGNPAAEDLNDRLFYAHLYIGLYYEALGDKAKAAEHVNLSATKHAVDGYMGDVARVHAWWLASGARPATQPAAGR